MAERRVDEAWVREQLSRTASRVLPVVDGLVAVRRSANGIELGWMEQLDADPAIEYTLFLGQFGGQPLFAAGIAPDAVERYQEQHAIRFEGLRNVAQALDDESVGFGAYARALDLWQRHNRHCPGCGEPTTVAQGGFSRRCERCERDHFPRVDPAIIVAVTHEDRLLLGRQAEWPKGLWSVLAGFVEPGETLESAVRREVAEESGVRVGEVHYRGSQPWPFPASLMIGFRGVANDPTLRAGEELEAARWFDVETLRRLTASGEIGLSSAFSISRYLIDEWVHEMCGEDSHLWNSGGSRE